MNIILYVFNFIIKKIDANIKVFNYGKTIPT